jgi:RNA polymerase sigma-32 factor
MQLCWENIDKKGKTADRISTIYRRGTIIMKISAKEIKRKHQRPAGIPLDMKTKELSPVKRVNFGRKRRMQTPREPKLPLQMAVAKKAERKASELKVAFKHHSLPPLAKKAVQRGGPKSATAGPAHAPPRPAPKLVKPKGTQQPTATPALTEEPSSRAESPPCDEKDCPKRVAKKSPNTTIPKVFKASRSKKNDDEKALVKFDPLHRYLSEISKYRLLTREEERDYGIRVMEQGDQDAAYVLVTANLRLVVKIALQFQRVWMQNLLDLIQEGNIGLMQAVQKFDPYKNVKFSYYASFWIKAYILKFIMDNWRLVKIGTTQGQRKLFFKLKKEKQHLIDQGFDPQPKLLSERMGVSEREIVDMDQRLDGWDVSLDAPLRDDSKTERIEFLESDAETVEDQVSKKQLEYLLHNKISAFRKTISPREVDIFGLRYLSEDRVTLQAIGDRYGISRERVRQIENAIIRKMRGFFEREIPDFATYTEYTEADNVDRV